ncbi:MAG: class I SAM-dependent methyltransferase [Bacteroidetes bacterium]|nr:class I SAM-dependent methyltransferase [Bacteroidota bacterium]
MANFLKRIDNFFFGSLQHHYARSLEKECAGCDTLLDVGCGSDSPVKFFTKKIKKATGIDMFQPSIDKSRQAGIHHDYKLMNVMEMTKAFREKSFDVVVASDLIEHLEKPDGIKLMEMMEKLARKKVVIYTPNGFLEQREYEGNKLQVHLSGWEVEEMRQLGYKVFGINGWKPLRGEFAVVKWWPRIFWGRISLLTQKRMFARPEKAFGIMCVKEFN